MIINSLVINLISSGRVLVDAIDKVLENEYGKAVFYSFRQKKVDLVFDRCFSYRFFYWLRNICQHGYIPVSRKYDGRYCFDLSQLLAFEHYNYHSNDSEKELRKIRDEIKQIYSSEPDLAFSINISEYVKAIYNIYLLYLEHIKDFVRDIHNKVSEIIKNHPEYIISEMPFAGMIMYKSDDFNAHFIPSQVTLFDSFSRSYSKFNSMCNDYDKDHFIS